MLPTAVIPRFDAFSQLWKLCSKIELIFLSVTTTNLELISSPASEENAISCIVLECMMLNYMEKVYKDDWLYVIVSRHHLGVYSLK